MYRSVIVDIGSLRGGQAAGVARNDGRSAALVSAAASRTRLAIFLPSLAGGGAERVMLNIANGFAERGIGTDLVLARAEGPYLPMVSPAVRVVDLGAGRVLKALGPLAAYLARERPQTLFSALNHANVIAMVAARAGRSRPRTAISIHCSLSRATDEEGPIRRRAMAWLLGRLHPMADTVVAVSEGVADDLAETAGIPRDRIDVVYNPVVTPDLLSAGSAPPPHPWFEDPTRPIVLGVGRLTRQKNFALLIDAFAQVRREHDARLVILGEGPERPDLEACIARYQLREHVALPGFVDNPHACTARATVLALSSDWEGLPTVLIESLALATPVVSTDCESGPREILRDGDFGELVPPGDASALARAISRVLSGERGAPSLEAVRRFGLDSVLDRFNEVLQLDG